MATTAKKSTPTPKRNKVRAEKKAARRALLQGLPWYQQIPAGKN